MTNELVIATNVVSREISGLDVVNSVNGFYSGAFDKLFNLVLALIAFFGVIIPILVGIYQRRVMKVSESELKAEMAILLEEKKKELLTEIENRLKTEKEIIDKSLQSNSEKIERQLKSAQGGIFHLQGFQNCKEGNFLEGAHDFCRAAELNCEAQNGSNLAVEIDNLTKVVAENFDKEALDYRGFKERISKLKEKIKETDKGQFTLNSVTKLEVAIENAQKKNKEIK
jgi:hypothetical protein